jgi:peptidoglycan/xylan/chitin deacetylase (PgdA/CDA1 family)
MSLTTLIYHDVLPDDGADDSGFSGADAASYKLTARRFERHLQIIGEALGAARPTTIGSDGAPAGAAASGLVLSFDDGGASGVERIAGALEARGWQAHFFVTSDYIGKPGFLSPSDLHRLRDGGHIIGSHSLSHPARISHCSPAQIKAEWQDSCARISDILGAPVTTASVPGGFYSAEVGRLAAEAGIKSLFTSEPTVVISRLHGMDLIGRFSVTRRTSDAHLRALVRARPTTLLGHRLSWGGKKLLKRAGGGAWIALRRKLFDLGFG